MVTSYSYWRSIWTQYRRHLLGMCALGVVGLFVVAGVYAPLLASSRPLVVNYDGTWYFPLGRYLFFRGYYTTALDLFFNLLMFIMPLALLVFTLHKRWRLMVWGILLAVQIVGLAWLLVRTPDDPASDPALTAQRLSLHGVPTWEEELRLMPPYARLNLVLKEQESLNQQAWIASTAQRVGLKIETPWEREQVQMAARLKQLQAQGDASSLARLHYLQARQQWLQAQLPKLQHKVMPLIRPFHWEEDSGGDQALNPYVHWWQLTRSGGMDLTAALIFGVRVSLIVGLLAVSLALLIGIPVGAVAGFYGGWLDILVSRLLEIWESMPTFFMLLFIVALLQSKSILLVVLVIGIFGWTGFSRYIRGEFFKQRNLPYVEACHAMGFNDSYIMFRHILPNAIPPLLTLLPFAVMGAISTEAGLSFLGLGDAGSCSWGVLMDEGRQAFPAESYLLWPPAILLTVLLVAIALVGDALRDAIDPRLHVI